MSDLLNEVLNRCIDDWLEKALLPMACKAARLLPETTLDELLQMAIPKANSESSPGCAEDVAKIRCGDNFLFGSLILAAKMAGTARAEQIKDCIQGLIWRDAVELGRAVTLYQDMCASDCLDQATIDGQVQAEAIWEPWEATDQAAKDAMADFLAEYCDQKFFYEQH